MPNLKIVFWKTENKIEPKRNFYSEIKKYFVGLTDDQIPSELLHKIISLVTEEVYGNYKRFWKQYPKSRKRYSKLKIEDVEHPLIRYMITDFFEEKNVVEIRKFSKILFKMDEEEFNKYVDDKHWYETK